jgi:Arc/MetJ-type ribon-helix-helix transcriptional regulator
MEAAMRTTQQLSITLPNDMADVVKTKVKTGEYASESEVIRDGLRALLRVIAPSSPASARSARRMTPQSRPSRAVTADQVRARLAAEHAKAHELRGVFSPEAEEQLAELYRYIAAAASPDVAARYTEAIVTYCESLRTFHCAAPCATMCGPACASRTTASAP